MDRFDINEQSGNKDYLILRQPLSLALEYPRLKPLASSLMKQKLVNTLFVHRFLKN